ncbi:unnamed protein product [Paramecium pentaurelia]|uniref:Uncharacterized protein n=1 Tax=Paramecium pentaurelia TaxID=43138 RepID=A0A8S1S4H6_9CILI|nr:unnamed protein product [Paramecium pentaurelia]
MTIQMDDKDYKKYKEFIDKINQNFKNVLLRCMKLGIEKRIVMQDRRGQY